MFPSHGQPKLLPRSGRARRSVLRLTATAAVLVILGGCSSDDSSAEAPTTTEAAAPPTAGVESFCEEFADVVVQDDPDFGRLDAAAPEAVKAEVSEVVEFSEMAATAEEEPDEDVIEGFQRSVAGMTIYAVGQCDNLDDAIETLGLDEEDLKLLRTYSLDDVRNDDTWPKVKKALGQP